MGVNIPELDVSLCTPPVDVIQKMMLRVRALRSIKMNAQGIVDKLEEEGFDLSFYKIFGLITFVDTVGGGM